MSLTHALLLTTAELKPLLSGESIFCYPNIWISQQITCGLCAIPDDDPDTIEVIAWADISPSERFHDDDRTLPIIQTAEFGEWYELKQKLTSDDAVVVSALRVYHLDKPQRIHWRSEFRQSHRRFIPYYPNGNASNDHPVLASEAFQRRSSCLKTRQIPIFFGCIHGWLKHSKRKIKNIPGWIETIEPLGTRSIEEDTGKTNYKAGTDFENIVKDSLKDLGFTIDEEHKGGAGGLDLYCSTPFPLVGECKAGKKIPNTTVQQLSGLGITKLEHEGYQNAAKVIIGPGKPSTQTKEGAKSHNILIMSPDMLQDLVKLHATYPGSIDLSQLEPILKSANSDQLKQHIETIQRSLSYCQKIRKFLHQICQELELQNISSETLFVVYRLSNPKHIIEMDEFRHILIELSSPQFGYIGRTGDRYYPIP
jgi:hypothetical protein